MVFQPHSVMYGDHEERILPPTSADHYFFVEEYGENPQKFHKIFCKLVSLMIVSRQNESQYDSPSVILPCDSGTHKVGNILHLQDSPPNHLH